MKRLLLLAWMGVALAASAAADGYDYLQDSPGVPYNAEYYAEKEPLARILGFTRFSSSQRKYQREQISLSGFVKEVFRYDTYIKPGFNPDYIVARPYTLAYIGNTKQFGNEDIRNILNRSREVKRIDVLTDEHGFLKDHGIDRYRNSDNVKAINLGFFDFMQGSIERYILLRYGDQLEYGDTFVAYWEGFDGWSAANPQSDMICWSIRYDPLHDENYDNLSDEASYELWKFVISEVDSLSRNDVNTLCSSLGSFCFDSRMIVVKVTYN